MSENKNTGEYLTTEEAAVVIKRSKFTLNRYAKEGRIKRYKRGFNVMYKRSDVERLDRELNEIREDE